MTKKNTLFGTPSNYIEDCLNNLLKKPINTKITSPQSKIILKAIFDNHPVKTIPDGDYEFLVFREKEFNTKCFAIKDCQNNIQTFSKSRIYMSHNENFRSKFSRVCRRLISDQVNHKKNELIKIHGLRCQHSNKLVLRKNLQLNHDHPYSFNVIVDIFLLSNKLSEEKDHTIYNKKGDLTFKDYSLEAKFLEHHQNFLDRNFVSLISKEINNKLGASFRFKKPSAERNNSIQNSNKLNLWENTL